MLGHILDLTSHVLKNGGAVANVVKNQEHPQVTEPQR